MYTYADGSGNLYELSAGETYRIRFRPVKPATSSSGFYDGGRSQARFLEADEYRGITELMDSAIANTAVHIEHRIMTSAMITATTEAGTTRVILSPRCAEKQAIEKLLRLVLE